MTGKVNSDIKEYINHKKSVIDKQLLTYFPKKTESDDKLYESIHYSINSDGKRLRPIMCLATCEMLSGCYKKAIPIACSIEMIHTYSLIHDDLPSMDNDDYRRDKPSNHKVYGESIAILAGDALLTDAFTLIIEECVSLNIEYEKIVKMILLLSKLAGSKGMVLGQAIDLSIVGKDFVDKSLIENSHLLKTGSMIEASVILGAIIANANELDLSKLKKYSKNLGLAFQIADDILDIEGHKDYGKKTGSDARNNKPTYAKLEGAEKSRARVEELTNIAIMEIDGINEHYNPLKDIAYYLIERIN